MWSLLFVTVVVTSILAIMGKETCWMWGWPMVIMVLTINSNRQFDVEMDIMKITINQSILDSLKGKECA